jgi:hypothetical protein
MMERPTTIDLLKIPEPVLIAAGAVVGLVIFALRQGDQP